MLSLLMSYPRSGNHLVRAYLEAASGRPSHGCRANPLDTPIRDRFSSDPTAPFQRVSDEPIAHKIHWISEELSMRRLGERPERLCFIIRDPAKCVVSQIVRSIDELPRFKRAKAYRHLSERWRLEQKTLAEVEHWCHLVDHFLASDLPKLVVGFEDLLSEARLSLVNENILPFFGVASTFANVEELDRVAEYGREGQVARQKTLPKEVYDKFDAISQVVREAVVYDEVRARLGLQGCSEAYSGNSRIAP